MEVATVEAAGGVALVAATVTMGLFAGLLYGYACSVMPALRRIDDRTFVAVMQRINVAILNGWFATSFAGAPLLTALAAVLASRGEGGVVVPWVVAALAAYGVAFAITMTVNVPLNNALAAAGDPRHMADPSEVRARFESRWVRWNVVRGVAATAALGCLAWALMLFPWP